MQNVPVKKIGQTLDKGLSKAAVIGSQVAPLAALAMPQFAPAILAGSVALSSSAALKDTSKQIAKDVRDGKRPPTQAELERLRSGIDKVKHDGRNLQKAVKDIRNGTKAPQTAVLK